MESRGSGGKAARQAFSSGRQHPYRKEQPRQGPPPDEVLENKLYVGNLDHRVTEYHVLKLFSPFGQIKREEYLWHTHGPRRGEPRGYAFVEYATRQEAERARAEMNGKPAFGRPLVVRFVDEKVVSYNQEAPVRTRDAPSTKVELQPGTQAVLSKNAKIAAIQSKLRMMEQEDRLRSGTQKKEGQDLASSSSLAHDKSEGQTSAEGLPVGGLLTSTEQDPLGPQRKSQSRTLLTSGHRWLAWG